MANLYQILFESSLGWGKGCMRFWGRSDKNSSFHGNRKLTLTYNRENVVRSIASVILIGSSSNLQVTRTSIKSQTSSILGQIGPFTLKLLALERQKIFPKPYNGENIGRMIATSLLIGSSSILQVTSTAIKSWMSSNSGLVRLSTSELLALERQKSPYLTLSDR